MKSRPVSLIGPNRGSPSASCFLASLLAFLAIGPIAHADFTIAVLPDTQYYSDPGPEGGTVAMFTAQTDWIKNNRAASNIVYVAHLGDMTDTGDSAGDVSSLQQWKNTTNAMYRLESPVSIPYGPCVGNHDQTPNGNPTGTTTGYNQYFGTSHFSGRSYYGGYYGSNNDSHYDLFTADGVNYIVIYIEYDPNDVQPAVTTWAYNLLGTYSSRKAIVVSHFIGNGGAPLTTFGPQGQRIYDALKTRPNVILMLSGHVGTGWGRRQDIYNGKTSIRTLVSNYQFDPEGGGGYMRLYTIRTGNSLQATTYSPYHNAFKTDGNNQFFFSLDKRGSSEESVTLLPDGRLATAIVNADTSVSVNKQTTPEGSWEGWQSLAGFDFRQISLTSFSDNRLAVFGVGEDVGPVNFRYQTNLAGAWSPWTNIGTTVFSYCKAIRYNDDRLAVAACGYNTSVYIAAQPAAGAPFNPWFNLGGTGFRQIDVVKLPDERLAVFGVGAGGAINVNIQNTYNGSWGGWQVVGGTGFWFIRGVAKSNGDLAVFGTGPGTDVYYSEKPTAGSWSTLTGLGGSGFYNVDAVIFPDQKMAVFGTGEYTGANVNVQTVSGGAWGGWLSIPGNSTGLGSQKGSVLGNGKLVTFAHQSGYPEYFSSQTSSNGTWNTFTSLGASVR